MANTRPEFAQYCCELLATLGTCTAKRMFGGWGISTDGLTVAIIADLGSGEKLWLKASEDNRLQWEAAGCERFTYGSTKDGHAVTRGINYYSAPEEAMDSQHAMAPWARMALQAALSAKAAKPAKTAARKTPAKAAKKKPSASKPAKPARKTAK
jgi:DNA transformation protein and related proteins